MNTIKLIIKSIMVVLLTVGSFVMLLTTKNTNDVGVNFIMLLTSVGSFVLAILIASRLKEKSINDL
jgi:hypothetical protein